MENTVCPNLREKLALVPTDPGTSSMASPLLHANPNSANYPFLPPLETAHLTHSMLNHSRAPTRINRFDSQNFGVRWVAAGGEEFSGRMGLKLESVGRGEMVRRILLDGEWNLGVS